MSRKCNEWLINDLWIIPYNRCYSFWVAFIIWSMMAGYSSTPLLRKLGIKSGSKILVRNEPPGYWDWLAPLPDKIRVMKHLSGKIDFIHFFVETQRSFEDLFTRGKICLEPSGMLWISWPKKASGISSDLNENQIRDFGLQNGMVDVKVCAVDHTWSGLKFVFRLADRLPYP